MIIFYAVLRVRIRHLLGDRCREDWLLPLLWAAHFPLLTCAGAIKAATTDTGPPIAVPGLAFMSVVRDLQFNIAEVVVERPEHLVCRL